MRSASSSTCSRRTTCSPNGSPGSCTTSPSMPSPGKAGVSEPRQAADFLREAREQERAACLSEAIASYEAAVAAAERGGERTVLAEALRRLAVVRRHRSEVAAATALCQQSYEVARQSGDDLPAAEALNTLGGLYLPAGALAYHNLGMVSADRGWLNAADCYFRESRALAERVGDVYLRGLCLVNHAELDVTRQRFEDARQKAEEALAVFDQLGAKSAKAEAYRVIGMVYRETGRIVLAESRLRSAIELAATAGAVLGEAEASRELALLYQAMARNQEALRLLNTASRLFQRLDARVDLIHVGGKLTELKEAYLAVVRAWGQSIESSDSYTFGRCERVARNAVAMARVLELDDHDATAGPLGG